jgi:hypothetical protein
MSPLVRRVLLLVLTVSAAFAALGSAPLFFGDPVPLTPTHYGSPSGVPAVASNGSASVLVTAADESIRAARIVDGQLVTSQFALASTPDTEQVSIVWTGTRFLVAASSIEQQRPVIRGRFLDAQGAPAGSPFIMLYDASDPQLASNQDVTMLAARKEPGGEVFAYILDGNGVAPLSSTPYKLASRAAHGPDFDLASNGNTFMAVTSSAEELNLTRFDRFGSVISQSTFQGNQGASRPRPATITSNGSGYLLVWLEGSRTGFATYIDANGTALPGRSFDEILSPPNAFLYEPTAVWSGSDWVISYAFRRPFTHELRVVRMDEQARAVTVREPNQTMPDGETSVSALLARGGVVSAFWHPQRFGAATSLVQQTLPFATSTARNLLFDPFDQKVLAAESTPGFFAILWNESRDRVTTSRLTITDRRNSYSEQILELPATAAEAAGDDGLVFVTSHPTASSTAVVLGPAGNLIKIIELTFRATDVTWNGDIYVVVGESEGRVVAAEITPIGDISSFKVIAPSGISPRIDSDGNEFLVAWLADSCVQPCFAKASVHASRVDTSRNRIDAGPDLTFAPPVDGASYPTVAWNPLNASYIVGWLDGRSLFVWNVPSVGTPSILDPLLYTGSGFQKNLTSLTTRGTVALAWTDDEVTRIVYLNVLTKKEREFSFAHPENHVTGVPVLANVAEGETAILFSELRTDAPWHGSLRVMIATSTDAVPGPPQTPALAASLRADGDIVLSWTASDTNIDHFRLEYRVGAGPWLEIEQYIPETQRSLVFDTVTREPHSFRIRSVSEDDWSGYSNETTVRYPTDGKRRSIRK